MIAPSDLDHYRARFLQDLLTVGLAACWERRALMFDDARPKPSDYTGRATAAELAALDARVAQNARRCRQHAALLRASSPEGVAPMVWEALAEAGAAEEADR